MIENLPLNGDIIAFRIQYESVSDTNCNSGDPKNHHLWNSQDDSTLSSVRENPTLLSIHTLSYKMWESVTDKSRQTLSWTVMNQQLPAGR